MLRDCERNCEENQKLILDEERKKSHTAIETALAEEREKMKSVIETMNVSVHVMYKRMYMPMANCTC